MMLAIGLAAGPATAQFSDSYKFLKAVRDRDGAKVTEVIDQPGSTLVNVRGDDGDAALHIVTKRRDATWLAFLLAKGAKPDVRDTQGNTPLGLAAQIGFSEGAALLIDRGAGVNATNNQGETPLILSVQARDLATVRLLLASGANPALTDRVAGLSARDYAARDRRSAAILKLIDDTKPAKPKGPVAGPRL
ncbi:ankyrin repeat domain-containing protein [Sphingomonas profundi]|uniref:ankyrin repeat domain-containing protein n=1 Tax=Alterirhizorhabdus profundi TaxID=2681549 RepID=UPI001E494BD5|nr:ankyrin repeat domain-containing protein [Sphingomonas profundi]